MTSTELLECLADCYLNVHPSIGLDPPLILGGRRISLPLHVDGEEEGDGGAFAGGADEAPAVEDQEQHGQGHQQGRGNHG